jgi:hypothetical protein
MKDMKEFARLFRDFTQFKMNRFHPLVWINGEPEIGKHVCIGGMSEINATGRARGDRDHCDILPLSPSTAPIRTRNASVRHPGSGGRTSPSRTMSSLAHTVSSRRASIGHHSVVAAGTIVEDRYSTLFWLRQTYAGQKRLPPNPADISTNGKAEQEEALKITEPLSACAVQRDELSGMTTDETDRYAAGIPAPTKDSRQTDAIVHPLPGVPSSPRDAVDYYDQRFDSEEELERLILNSREIAVSAMTVPDQPGRRYPHAGEEDQSRIVTVWADITQES